MQCSQCRGTALRILQSRRNPSDNNSPVIRQRVCKACSQRWFTAEVPIPSFTVTQGTCGHFRTSALIQVHNTVAA